jgi:hypothetical protein
MTVEISGEEPTIRDMLTARGYTTNGYKRTYVRQIDRVVVRDEYLVLLESGARLTDPRFTDLVHTVLRYNLPLPLLGYIHGGIGAGARQDEDRVVYTTERVERGELVTIESVVAR